MTDEGKYIRVYYSVVDDERFVTIIDNEAFFGTWTRLLMSADAVWPASADIPRWVKPEALKALVDAGVIDLVAGDRFRVHGLDKERERRSQAGRAGGLASGRARGMRTPVERSMNERSTTVERKGNLDKTSTSRDKKVPTKGIQGRRPLDGAPRTSPVDPMVDAPAQLRETWPSDVPEIVQHAWHRRTDGRALRGTARGEAASQPASDTSMKADIEALASIPEPTKPFEELLPRSVLGGGR